MYSLQQQRGIATVLLVTLLGITVMVITAVVAKSATSRKESTVAAHAQTNAQILAWAGVSAFQQYLKDEGAKGVANVKALNNKTITLRSNAKQVIKAENIQIIGCDTVGGTCQAAANISADSTSAKAASTVNVMFDLTVVSGNVVTVKQPGKLSFGGNTNFTGNVIIDSPTPNSEAILNSDGNLKIWSQGLITKNISKLTINSSGNVYIDCAITNCGSAIIDVNAKGTVFLSNSLNFGNIKALGAVSLAAGAYAKDIITQDSVTMTGWSRAASISADGLVNLYQATILGDVESKKRVVVSDSTVGGNVKSYDYVEMNTNAKIGGSVYGKGNTKFSGDVAVSHSASTVKGNVYTNKDLHIWGLGSIAGHVYATGVVKGISDYVMKGGYTEKMTSIPELDFTITKPDALTNELTTATRFDNKVDVRVYKNDANYIFTKANTDQRVYLNQLKNKATGIVYLYENGNQYAVSGGTKQLLNATGFEIGQYQLNGEWLDGALCQSVDANRHCTSDIVGYLPRISVSSTLGINDVMGYGNNLNIWRLRSLKNSSGIDNAVLAPGIMYFEGHLELAGNANWSADSQTSAYVNSFLAEGQITPLAFSPTIYSPYNVIRAGQPNLVCNRTLKDVNGNALNINNTTPKTLSDKYLVPINLCQDDVTFAKTMDKNADGTQKMVTIDGVNVPKLDLGNVAFMANIEVNIGACTRVFGDVLARLETNFSASCGITNVKNMISGNVTSQGLVASGIGSASNDIMAGTNIVVPDSSVPVAGAPGAGPVINIGAVKLTWTKML